MHLTHLPKIGTKLNWIASTTLSALVGLWVARWLFPTAFNSEVWEWRKTPVEWDIFGLELSFICDGMCVRWDVIGFSLLSGLWVAGGQSAIVCGLLRRIANANRYWWIWLAITWIGVSGGIMAYSQWGNGGLHPYLIFSWGFSIIPLFPGIVFLGFGQGMILLLALDPKDILPLKYLIMTLIGAVSSFILIPIVLILSASLTFINFERGGDFLIFVVSFTVFFFNISLFQSFVLERAFKSKMNGTATR